jgi:hypothetical protein
VHALMIAVMGAAMLVGSPIAAVLGALVLVIVAVPCGALSREPSRAFLRAHVVDLWAMALTMLALVPAHSSVGHHSFTVPAAAGFAIVVARDAGALELAGGSRIQCHHRRGARGDGRALYLAAKRVRGAFAGAEPSHMYPRSRGDLRLRRFDVANVAERRTSHLGVAEARRRTLHRGSA